ncbi:thiamine ABC transporter substrate-binding protein [Allokutzneria sp. A3M-2-11 16]|uniref:thiamine ABC transporter substrate-binding protein n=1 Tax=Allokutzneria sp. A3M-2-11 16 TaxID=2962043 RepID=UPI0020B6880B|nr:thiamine ABC transporter substrate-binding protein [Allokutzneria sp. A3M-2-11 16]MCP3798653.1 thiamine ABC transporter substrate-binding protein [Allokutzneria sp. A3M-2-11 16]
MRSRTLGALLVLALVSGCSLTGGNGAATGGDKVVLVTHNSFALPKPVLDEFTKNTGITIEISRRGDAGEMTNQLVLTKGNPLADAVYGIDSTYASRALGQNLLQPYKSPEAAKGAQRYAVAGGEDRLSAVDVGDVCLNIDTGFLAQRGIPEPTSLADLTDPRFKDLLVVQNPATSSPGLAFLFATVATFGEERWAEYWTKLKANGVKVASGWEESYSKDFSGSSGKGPRPLVVSYASSPSAEVGQDGKPRTKALLNGCYRQVEYAGVLNGAKNADGARKVVDFLLSDKVQSQLAEQMFVYPTREGVALPQSWQVAAPLPTKALELPAQQVDRDRERWLALWRSIVQG